MYYIAQVMPASVARTYLARQGFAVIGEEPNEEMRSAVIDLNRRFKTFKEAKPHLDACNAVTSDFVLIKL